MFWGVIKLVFWKLFSTSFLEINVNCTWASCFNFNYKCSILLIKALILNYHVGIWNFTQFLSVLKWPSVRVTEHCAVQDGNLLIIVILSQKKIQVCRVGLVIQVQIVYSDTCFYCDAVQLLYATVSLWCCGTDSCTDGYNYIKYKHRFAENSKNYRCCSMRIRNYVIHKSLIVLALKQQACCLSFQFLEN